jgi:DNA helicase-2/ATP-dependent DNA helicase PcrA
MINYQQELNEEQYKVVAGGDGRCLVLAGAGSGKTRTITYRVAYLLEQGIDPSEILLVTFTNKAAHEMKERVSQLTGGKGNLPWSGTFHHIGYRILRQYAPVLGYKQNFTILDSEDSTDLLKLCMKGEGIDRTERRFPSAKVLGSIMSYARNAETTIADVVELQHPNFEPLIDIFVRIAEAYRIRKLDANAMDFDDLLVNLYLLLLKSSAAKEKFSQQFKYVLVDEYQDTNRVQSSIVRELSSYHQNLLVVGDDAQSIYSFRAADIQHILAFEQHYPNAQIFRLETNYRSTPEILNLANDVINKNLSQYEKALLAHKASFMRPEVQAFTDAREEADFIADIILELHSEGIRFADMAVLFRAAYHSQSLEMELTKRDIPYEFRGGMRFFARSHIKDVLAYLRIINNLEDTVAWSRVLNMQVGIGPVSAEKIIQAVRTISNESELAHLGSLLSARAQIGWGNFLQIWEVLMRAPERTPSALITAAIDSPYAEYLENEYPDYRERLRDLEQLAVFAEQATDLNTFLAEASMQESFATAKAAAEGHDEDDVLILSTIHQAKGLEWKAVFVMGLAAGQFPSERSLRTAKDLEEERRLFYVAVTRAEQYLYLTYPLTAGFGSFLAGPSLFLEEVNRELLSESGRALGGSSTVFLDPSDDVDDITYEPFDDDMPRRSFLKGLDEL